MKAAFHIKLHASFNLFADRSLYSTMPGESELGCATRVWNALALSNQKLINRSAGPNYFIKQNVWAGAPT